MRTISPPCLGRRRLKFHSLGERVAAFETGASKTLDEVAISSRDAAEHTQRAKFARSAVGKARPRSSPFAAHAPPATNALGRRRSHVLSPRHRLRRPQAQWGNSCCSTSQGEEHCHEGVAGIVRPAAARHAGADRSRDHHFVTLQDRDDDPADVSYKALVASPRLQKRSKGKELKDAAFRVKPPAIRQRGLAFSPFYQAIERSVPSVQITQNHRAKGRFCASGGPLCSLWSA